MATIDTLLTANEFAKHVDPDRPNELVRGRILVVNVPTPRHGYVCARLSCALGQFADDYDLGRVFCNNAGVITERDPDTVRGADVSYFSYARLPKGPLPAGYLSAQPELVFEVKSLSDRWSEIHKKVAEYLAVDILIVGVLDPETQTIDLFYPDQPARKLTIEDELTLSEVLPSFSVPVRKLFE